MLDNIKLQFKDKTVVEKWLNANGDKFPTVQRKHITTNVTESKEKTFVEKWLDTFRNKFPALQKRQTTDNKASFTTYPIIADIENLKLRISEKMAVLEGSIHKYFNHLMHNDLSSRGDDNDYSHLLDNNYNDFYYTEILQSLETLQDFFEGLDLNDATITELEFGFNLKVERDPDDYINYNFLLYDYKAPTSNYNDANTCFVKFLHSKFGFKVYSKKKQKHLHTNIMRVEIVLKSNHLRELGITQFDDLFVNESIEKLYTYFREKMDNFILTDNRNQKEGLAENVKLAIGNYLEPSFWRDLKGKPNINRVKQAFQKLLTDNDMLHTKAYFKDLLDRKYEQLFYGVVDDDIQNIE